MTEEELEAGIQAAEIFLSEEAIEKLFAVTGGRNVPAKKAAINKVREMSSGLARKYGMKLSDSAEVFSLFSEIFTACLKSMALALEAAEGEEEADDEDE